MDGVAFTIGRLDGLLLGVASGREIVIDATAAGWGWSVAATETSGYRMDLRATVLHELGHVLGYDHDDHHHAFMAETLAAVWVQTVWVQLPERLRPVATLSSAVPTLGIRAPQPCVTLSSPKRGSIRLTQPARIRSAKPSPLKKTTLAKPHARS